MYTISYFGNNIQATGSIRSALSASGVDVGNNEPYANGQRVSLDDAPAEGATVTFRPRQSGKA